MCTCRLELCCESAGCCAGGGAGEGSCGGSGRPHSAPFGGAPRAGEAGSEEGETPRNRARSRAGSALKRGRSATEPDAVKARAPCWGLLLFLAASSWGPNTACVPARQQDECSGGVMMHASVREGCTANEACSKVHSGVPG